MTDLHRYELWAPDATSVEVRIGAEGERAVPMTRRGTDPTHGAGWWEAEADPGDGRYAFVLNGGFPVPDPRSRRQPEGVHRPSALHDPSTFAWSDHGWRGVPIEEAVVYELHVGTFTPERTFDGVIEHLDHLVELGVNVLEIMPVAAFPGRHGWGYDGVGIFAVHEPYGGPEGLCRLVDAAHAKGLAVWLDVVHNHLGPSGNYLGMVGPYFTDRHHTPWGQALNLDGPGSDEVRRFVLENVAMWLEDYHLDGLRLDAVHALHDERAVHLLEDMAALAEEVSARTGIPRSLVAESDRNDPATVAPRGSGGAGGLGLAGQWADDVHHALHVALTGETQGYYADFAADDALPKVLARTPFFHDGTFSTFRGRAHGRPVDPTVTPGHRYVASLQTHDQIGNRAAGDRLGHSMPAGRAAIGAALLLTSPYTPMLFMGEEFAASTPWQYFTDHEEDWLADSIRAGRQAEFAEHGWSGEVPDPQDEGTVQASTLRWEEVTEGDHARMLSWYAELLRLRREEPALRTTPLGQGACHSLGGTAAPVDLEAADADVQGGGRVIVVRRGDVSVVARLGGDRGQIGISCAAEVLATFGDMVLEEGSTRLVLGADSVVVLRDAVPEGTVCR